MLFQMCVGSSPTGWFKVDIMSVLTCDVGIVSVDVSQNSSQYFSGRIHRNFDCLDEQKICEVDYLFFEVEILWPAYKHQYLKLKGKLEISIMSDLQL